MTNLKSIKIAIADDHTIFLQGLVALLKQYNQFDIVFTALNGKELLEQLKAKMADIVITDISMPEMDGLQLVKSIKTKYPQLPVLVLTTHINHRMVAEMFSHGAKGYLFKDTSKEELHNAITTIANGGIYQTHEIKQILQNAVGLNKKTVTLKTELSERELQILKLIAEENTQQQIADKLFISHHTVVFHKRNLMQKLEAKNTAGLVKYANEFGLI